MLYFEIRDRWDDGAYYRGVVSEIQADELDKLCREKGLAAYITRLDSYDSMKNFLLQFGE